MHDTDTLQLDYRYITDANYQAALPGHFGDYKKAEKTKGGPR
jgi:hypothetical protein